MNDRKYLILYNLVTVILAVLVAIMVMVESNYELTPEQLELLQRIDVAILIVFAIDYFVRLYLAPDKLAFVRSNILHLIAIIPFDMIFRAARLTQLARIIPLLRLLRVASLLGSRLNIFEGIIKTNGLDRVLKATTGVILLGSIGIYLVEDSINNLPDALWWSIVTATTVGYGDISPTTMGGRAIAVILMFVGIGTIGMLTGSIATYFLTSNNRKVDPVKELIHERIEAIETLTPQEYQELLQLVALKRDCRDSSQ